MNGIGVSLPIETVVGTTDDEVHLQFLREVSGPAALLSSLSERGVACIELRDMRRKMPPEHTRKAVEAVHRAGMAVTLHAKFEETSGGAYLERVSEILRTALAGQDELLFTLHPLPDRARTIEKYREWSSAFAARDGRLRLAVENMRVTKPGTDHYRVASVAEIAAEGGRELCWDMGHYTYNVMISGFPPETLPPDDVLRAVTHTHIHSLYTPWMDTHHPLRSSGDPAGVYVAALRAAGYGGIYNLEMDFRRYCTLVSPKEGLLSSLDVLGSMFG